MEQWRTYQEKFLTLTPREQYLIIATGFIAIVFGFYSLIVEPNLIASKKANKSITQLTISNKSMVGSIATYKAALKSDPNKPIEKKIAQYEKKLASIDKQLLTLTSELIDPVQMRYALLELLDLQKGVSLVSFELMGVEALSFDASKVENKKAESSTIDTQSTLQPEESLTLYRHGVKVKLRGSYFHLRDYLSQLEALSWKFFWQNFEYNLQEYPESEVEIEMYSLSTKQEFIGV